MARKALKPPIEPLSEQTWQRLEDVVIARLRWEQLQPTPSRQPRMALLFAAASLAISALAVGTATGVLLPESPEPLSVRTPSANEVGPSVTFSTSTSEGSVAEVTPSAVGEKDGEARVFITTGQEPATYELGGSELLVAPESRLLYRGSDTEGWLVVVESGRVECEVAPRHGRPDFVVRAGTAEVRVIGTRFEVAYEEGQTSVSVDEGKVLVLDGGRQTVLRTGETWSATKVGQAVPAQGHGGAARHGAPSASARQDYELAASLESSDPARALSIYRRLSTSKGSWSANALYAQARLLKESGRHAEAKALLSRYLKLYPRGTNAADARRLLAY